jgi:predicted acyltransferase
MADPQPLLLNSNSEGAAASTQFNQNATLPRSPRVASVDVFRGLSVFLMILVDYGGSIFPIISHSPWNGLHLADFVMPFFLFLVGISLALAYKAT